MPLAGLIDGAAGYETRLLFPRGQQDPQPAFTVRITSPLRGMALNLPEPFAKPADVPLPVRGEIRFMPGGERIESSGAADNGIAWQLGFARPEGAWDLDRGVVQSGGGAIEPADTRGLHLRGHVESLRLEEWLSVSRSRDQATTAAGRIRSVELAIDDLYALGQHLENHHVRVDRSARDWLVQLDGEDVKGSVFVPYDFGAQRALTINMERLHLPGSEQDEGEPSTLDPRTLPPIELIAEDFALGPRQLGRVEALLARTDDGLISEKLEAVDETFQISGQGSWVADPADPLGSRTTVSASRRSAQGAA